VAGNLRKRRLVNYLGDKRKENKLRGVKGIRRALRAMGVGSEKKAASKIRDRLISQQDTRNVGKVRGGEGVKRWGGEGGVGTAPGREKKT